MTYHHNPIEPSDWSYGPDFDGPECHECEGTGEIIDSRDNEVTCPACGGSGFVQQEPEDE